MGSIVNSRRRVIHTMISIPPKNLQNALIFYITCIIVVTNGFFAILTLSRENLEFYNESVMKSVFLGRILQDPAREFLETGASGALEKVNNNRALGLEEIRVTLYDRHWWAKWGDPSRIPPEGFPQNDELKDTAFRSGVSGLTSREIFFPISTGSQIIGALGVGVPEFGSIKFYGSFNQVILTMLVNIFLGVTLAIFIAQVILRPLGNILEGLDGIKRGDYGRRVQVAGGGELQLLGEMFNLMAASLQDKIREGLERNRILDEKVQELWEIYELTKEMGFTLHLRGILERFLEKSQTLSFSSYGQILLHQPLVGRLEVQVETPSFPRISRDEYENNLNLCLRNGETIETKTAYHTLLFIPLHSGRLVQGVLFLGKQGKQSYSEGIRKFLETIAPLGGSLIENARLYQHVVEMKDYVKNVLESVDSGVATIDREDRLVTKNTAFGKILGFPDLEAKNQPVDEILSLIEDGAFRKDFENLLKESVEISKESDSIFRILERTARHQLNLQLPDKEMRIIQARLSPLIAGDTIMGKVVVLDDLTALKRIEKRMLESEKWAVLGRLAASVAHEIRNPLVAIRSLVEIIGEDVTGDQLNHVKVVLGEVLRLNKVVEQLLQLSRPEKTDLRETSLQDLLEELILLVRHEARRHKVEIKKEWLTSSPCVRIDPEQMKQAFLNVMLNAFQAMDDGGTLTVRILQSGSADTSNNNASSGCVMVEFEDQGTGIAPEIFDRIFDPFFTTRVHGTGLGLAITKKIIDLHNGRVEIESQPGKGACFRLIIPSDPDFGSTSRKS